MLAPLPVIGVELVISVAGDWEGPLASVPVLGEKLVISAVEDCGVSVADIAEESGETSVEGAGLVGVASEDSGLELSVMSCAGDADGVTKTVTTIGVGPDVISMVIGEATDVSATAVEDGIETSVTLVARFVVDMPGDVADTVVVSALIVDKRTQG